MAPNAYTRPTSALLPIRQAAATAKRKVGTALATWYFNDESYKTVAAREFDSLTAENQMKWETVEPSQGKFSFDAGDQLVQFAVDNGMRVRGHTLVWHSQLAPWVKNLSGNALRQAMIDHVKGVVGHWKGKIAQWDVVNEALADGSGELRPDSTFAGLGPTFIADAFRAAHEADPSAQLFYNDYEIEAPGNKKTEAAYELVKGLKASGVPIHGIGFQMHVDPRYWASADKIRENFERFAALGLLIEITEMDVPVGEIPGTLQEKLDKQRTITHDIVAACIAVPSCSGITFWGFTDKHSWLNEPRWAKLRGTAPHYPLPFDAAYQPKPMAYGIVDALSGR